VPGCLERWWSLPPWRCFRPGRGPHARAPCRGPGLGLAVAGPLPSCAGSGTRWPLWLGFAAGRPPVGRPPLVLPACRAGPRGGWRSLARPLLSRFSSQTVSEENPGNPDSLGPYFRSLEQDASQAEFQMYSVSLPSLF